jgi:hypothetical protein
MSDKFNNTPGIKSTAKEKKERKRRSEGQKVRRLEG